MLLLSILLFLPFLEASKRSQSHPSYTAYDSCAKRIGTESSPVVLDDSEEEIKSLAIVALHPYIDLTIEEPTAKKDIVVGPSVDEASCLLAQVAPDSELVTEALTPLEKAIQADVERGSMIVNAKLETAEEGPLGQNKPITRNGLTIARKRIASMTTPLEPLSKRQKIDLTVTISTTYSMGCNWKTHPIQIGSINRLVLFNLAHSTGIAELLSMFKVYGNIEEIEYVDDSLNSRANIAFIRFTNKLAIINAIANMRNTVNAIIHVPF